MSHWKPDWGLPECPPRITIRTWLGHLPGRGGGTGGPCTSQGWLPTCPGIARSWTLHKQPCVRAGFGEVSVPTGMWEAVFSSLVLMLPGRLAWGGRGPSFLQGREPWLPRILKSVVPKSSCERGNELGKKKFFFLTHRKVGRRA